MPPRSKAEAWGVIALTCEAAGLLIWVLAAWAMQ